MSVISSLQEFDGKQLGEDDSGDAIIGKLLPGLSNRELQEMQAIVPCAIPEAVKELLQLTRGIEPSLDSIDFSGISLQDSFTHKEIFPHGLPVAGDGSGNSWIVDLEPKTKTWGPVFYLSQAPKVVIWQAKTFEEFVAQLLAFSEFQVNSPINLVHDQFANAIAEQNPNVIPADKTQHPGDPDLGLFAQSLKKGYSFIDLRRARIGDGFSWERYGKDTELVRNGFQRLFAYRKKPNVIERLMGY